VSRGASSGQQWLYEQGSFEQDSPGLVQMPQLALQQT
jgi:hypothetical protein